MSLVPDPWGEEQGPGFVHHRAFSEEGLGEGWLRSLGVSHSESHSFIHKCSRLPVIFRTWMKQEAYPDWQWKDRNPQILSPGSQVPGVTFNRAQNKALKPNWALALQGKGVPCRFEKGPYGATRKSWSHCNRSAVHPAKEWRLSPRTKARAFLKWHEHFKKDVTK